MSNRNPTDMGGAFAGVPMCSLERCPSYDGKRCRDTGNEPGRVCVPEVRAIATARRDAEDRARMSPEGRATYDALLEKHFGETAAERERLVAIVERQEAAQRRLIEERDQLRAKLLESTRVGLEGVAAHARDIAERSALITAARDERNAAQDRALLLERLLGEALVALDNAAGKARTPNQAEHAFGIADRIRKEAGL